MGVFGGADAGPAGPAASAAGSAPACSRFWNPGPVLRSVPLSARRDDVVGGPSGLGRTAGHAPDDRRRSPSAACLWLQWAHRVAGIGRWRASAERWGRHPCARAKPLKGDPAMQLLGQETLRRGRATGGWQDSCAVHDLRASDGENAPWRQDVRTVHSPTALCGAFRMHGAHILPKLAVFEYMQAICCHEPVFFSSEPLRGTHQGTILPWPAAWECTRAQSCHGRQHGNASGRFLAMVGSLRTHQADILP